MARGWESKSVEAQQADAETAVPRTPPMSAEERAHAERCRALALSRAQVSNELQRATRPAHRAMLERALADIERELAALHAGGRDPSAG